MISESAKIEGLYSQDILADFINGIHNIVGDESKLTEERITKVCEFAMLFPINQLYPQIGKKVQEKINEDPTFAGTLQVPQLSKMLMLQLNPLKQEVQMKVIKDLAISICWYFWEIGSDNLALMNEGEFILSKELLEFNDLATRLLVDEITLSDALSAINVSFSLADVKTETTEKIFNKLLPGGIKGIMYNFVLSNRLFESYLNKKLDPSTKEFLTDPNKALLKLNILALDLVRDSFFDDSHPFDFLAIQGAINRYKYSSAILQNPNMTIEDAVCAGDYSILLIYTMSSYFKNVSKYDKDVRGFLDNPANSEAVEQIIMDIARIGRLGNDAIGAITHWESVKEILLNLKNKYNDVSLTEIYNNHPFELTELFDLCPMLEKDHRENEYNIALCSGGAKKSMSDLVDNLSDISELYKEAFSRFEKNISNYDDNIKSMFQDFLDWMLELYLSKLDFDKWEESTELFEDQTYKLYFNFENGKYVFNLTQHGRMDFLSLEKMLNEYVKKLRQIPNGSDITLNYSSNDRVMNHESYKRLLSLRHMTTSYDWIRFIYFLVRKQVVVNLSTIDQNAINAAVHIAKFFNIKIVVRSATK